MTGSVRDIVLISASLLMLPMPTHQSQLQARESAPPQAAGVVAVPPGNASPSAPTAIASPTDFQTWVIGVRAEALARGISEQTVNTAFSDLQPLPGVLERDRSQAEFVLSLDQYLKRRLTKSLIGKARANATKHRDLLDRVAAEYGVQSRFVVAIWGVESNYGGVSGTNPAIPALATLAWDGRRGVFFKGELLNALEIVDKGYIGLEALKGSWAGALGQTQFMPSSYLKYAQDFDRDGDRDIWRSEGDVFASIANYLKAYGWVPEQTWGREVRLPKSGPSSVIDTIGRRTAGCRAEREMTKPAPLARWQALGVRSADGSALPRVDRKASLVHNGRRSFLVYDNYQALLGYNCAHTYALSVALLADRIGS